MLAYNAKHCIVEIARGSNYYFSSNANTYDMVIGTSTIDQRILLGALSNGLPAIAIMQSNIGINQPSPEFSLDITGDAHITSNVIIDGFMGIGVSNPPSEKLDIDGNLKVSENTYVLNSLAVAHSNPTEAIDVMGSIKISNNAYILTDIAVAHSNPREAVDIHGSMKVSDDIYAMISLAVAHSNPTEAVDIHGSMKVSQEAYVLSNLAVAHSNPTEAVDIHGSMKVSQEAYVLSNLAVAHSNPTEAVDIHGSMKVSQEAYVLSNLAVAHSNPTEKLDVDGNAKISGNTYILSDLAIAHSNPTEAVDVLGNIKAAGDMYAISGFAVAHSNPTEAADIQGNLKVSSNIYTMERLGVGTSNPESALHVYGDLRIESNMIIDGSLGINTSNPQAEFHVEGDILASGTITTSNLRVIGDYVVMNTITSNTEQLTVNNDGTGPAIYARQTGSEPVATFWDDDAIAFTIADGAKIGVRTSNPNVSFEINATDALLLPKGSSNERPLNPEDGYIRYDTSRTQFEGYANGAWRSLGGVRNTLNTTYVSAEDDNTILFVRDNAEFMRITPTGLGINKTTAQYTVDIAGTIRADTFIGSLSSNDIAAAIDSNTIPDLPASKIVTGVFDTARIPDLPASKIISGVIDRIHIPTLDASNITTGVFDTARIPNLDASNITTGVFNTTRIPNLDASNITSGTIAHQLLQTTGSPWIANQFLYFTGSNIITQNVSVSQSSNQTSNENPLDFLSGGNIILGEGAGATVLYAGTGTETLPSFTFAGDMNTGIYNHSNSVLGLTAGGTRRMILGPSGIGINTDTPDQALTVVGGVSATYLYGDGANITNINASNISQGVIDVQRLPSITADRLSNEFWTPNQYLKYDGSNIVTEEVYGVSGLIDGEPTGGTVVMGDNAASGAFSAGSGQSNSPSYTFFNDIFTGLYNPTSNAVAITTGSIEGLRVTQTGVGVKKEVPLGTLHVGGNGLFEGDITAFYSDERLKTIVAPLSNSLDIICSLNPFKYTPNEISRKYIHEPEIEGVNEPTVHIGLSAQEVQRVVPEIVTLAPFDMDKDADTGKISSRTGENYLTVKYDKLVPYLISAIKELRAELAARK